MSAVLFVAIVGNILSTVSIVPHLLNAIRTHRPGGSVVGWLLTVASGSVWVVYAIVAGAPEVGTPSVVVVPVGAVLAAWIIRNTRRDRRRDAAMRLHPSFHRK